MSIYNKIAKGIKIIVRKHNCFVYKIVFRSFYETASDNILQAKYLYGQANKDPWWMPWSYPTMKAVVSCEKQG